MILILLAYIAVIIFAFHAPAHVRIILLIIDIIIPDPLPFIDEILLLIAVIKS